MSSIEWSVHDICCNLRILGTVEIISSYRSLLFVRNHWLISFRYIFRWRLYHLLMVLPWYPQLISLYIFLSNYSLFFVKSLVVGEWTACVVTLELLYGKYWWLIYTTVGVNTCVSMKFRSISSTICVALLYIYSSQYNSVDVFFFFLIRSRPFVITFSLVILRTPSSNSLKKYFVKYGYFFSLVKIETHTIEFYE